MSLFAVLPRAAVDVTALATIAYLSLALVQVLRFRPRRRAAPGPRAPVSVLVPVHGAPPGLEACLSSICTQDYPAYQVVFGLHAPDDPGRVVVERVMRAHPDLDAALVIDARRAGSNPKVCNLVNMRAAVRHEAMVVLDSDVVVEPGFLAVVVEALVAPGVGAVTCPYRALAQPGLASRLGATYIDEWFLPSALVEASLHEMSVCYGAAFAVTGPVLDAIGGFEALAFAVAEDDAIGAHVAAAGHRVCVVPHVVGTVVAEPDLGTLWRHELRWMRSVRECRPLDHALAVVTFAAPPTALLLVVDRSACGLALAGALIAIRLALHLAVRVRFTTDGSAWLVPLRETFGFAVWLASFASREMRWGEHVLRGTGLARAGPEPGDAA